MAYTDEELREKRLHYLRTCKPKVLRELQKSKQLDDHLEKKARRCLERAQDLIDTGTFEGQAWSWAVREVLLETEAD